MVVMDEELLGKYQNYINYSNADGMFDALEQIINKNGRDFILREEHETEEECVKSYVERSKAMRFAMDAIEHYAKAILIENGSTWNESKSWGHNLLDLFNNLDETSRSIVLISLMPLNEIEISSNSNYYNEYDKAIMYLSNKLIKYHYMNNPEEIKYNYIDNNSIKYNDYIYKDNYKMPYIPQEGNVVGIKDNQTVVGELEKLNPQNSLGQPKQQLFNIKARFPGQYLVEGNAEFLISLAYIMNKISIIYRKKEKIIKQL